MDRGFSGVGRGLMVSAKRLPDKPALIEIDRLTLTYSEMNRGANRLAHELAARGIGKGDHVAVLSENSLEHIVALYAIAKLGAVSVALDPRWTAHETARAITLFDCRLLVLDRALQDRLASLANGSLELGTLSMTRAERDASFSMRSQNARMWNLRSTSATRISVLLFLP